MTSAREELANHLADTCTQLGLNEVYGVNVSKDTEKGKTYYAVTFCLARILDGIIKVYSPKFILVKWQTQFRDMPFKGQEKFTSEEEAAKFIKSNFVRNAD